MSDFSQRSVWITPFVPDPILSGTTFVTHDGRVGVTEGRQGDDGYVFALVGEGGVAEHVRLSNIKDTKRIWE